MKVDRKILIGDSAAMFVRQRRETNPSFRARWDRSRISNRSVGLANLRVITMRPVRSTPGLLARLKDTFFDGSVVLASRLEEDGCEEYYNASLTAGSTSFARRMLRAGCEDIEEVNIYEDTFESGIHVDGSIGTSTTIEVVSSGGTDYQEGEVEFNFPVVDNGDGTAGVDPGFLAEVDQDPMAWLATNFWWIFSDPGYGSNDEFGDSGIPCDQEEDIKGWMAYHAFQNAFSGLTTAAGALSGLISCLLGSGGLTAWALVGCAAGGAFWGAYSTFIAALAYYQTQYFLDCVADILSPAGATVGRPLVSQPANFRSVSRGLSDAAVFAW